MPELRGLSPEELQRVDVLPAMPEPAKPAEPSGNLFDNIGKTVSGFYNELKKQVEAANEFDRDRDTQLGGMLMNQMPGLGGPAFGPLPFYEFKKEDGTQGGATLPPSQRQQAFSAVVNPPHNAAMLGINVVQRALSGKPLQPADPASTAPGRALNNLQRGLRSEFGLAQREDMTPIQQQILEDLPTAVGASAYTAPLTGFVGVKLFGNSALGALPQWLRPYAAAGATGMVEGFASSALEDNRTGMGGGSLFDLGGPLALTPQDDMVSGLFKAGTGNGLTEGLFGGLIVGGGAIGKASKEVFPNIHQRIKRQMQLNEVVDGRNLATSTGVQTEVSPGVYELNVDREAAEEILVGPPDAPEIDVPAQAVARLDDDRLAELAEGDGPVLDELEEQLQAQADAFEVEQLPTKLVSAPTDELAPFLVPYEDQLRSSAIPHNKLISLAHPDNGLVLHEKVVAMTGRDFEEFTREDVIKGILALRSEGLTVIPSRLQDGIALMDVGDIRVDPQRFQFKDNVTEAGVQRGGSLEGVKLYDTAAEGQLQVWQDVDGEYYVINGHNRLALAKKNGIQSVPVEVLIADSAEQARTLGAISNIKAGGGTPFDAAKVMREMGITDVGQLEAAGMPLKSGTAAQGLALSKLPDDILQRAINGEISVGRAATLGGADLDPERMRRLLAVADSKDVGEREFSELVQLAGSAPKVKGDQGVLFGDGELDLMLDKARLAAKVRARLVSDKNLFGKVGRKKNAARLAEKGGTEVDAQAVGSAAEAAQAVLGEFDATKYAGETPISALLNRGTEQVANGVAESKVVNDILRQLETAAETAPPPRVPEPEAPAVEAEPPPLTAEQRQAMQGEVLKRAVKNGEVRASSTELPTLPDGPRVDVEKALREGGTVDLTEDMATLAQDEIRLGAENFQRKQQTAFDMQKASREAVNYETMSLDEKKAAGMAADWKPGPGPQDTFKLPNRANSRYGMATVNFRNDLDRAAYTIRNKAKASKGEPAIIKALEAQGLDVRAVRAHGERIKKAIGDAVEAQTGTRRAPQEAMEINYEPVTFRQPKPLQNLSAVQKDPITGDYYDPDDPGFAKRQVSRKSKIEKQLAQLLTAEIRRIGGEHAEVRFTKHLPKRKRVPPEWGGDVEAVTLGTYNMMEDIVKIEGLMDRQLGDLVTTAWHEAYHRVQFGLLTKEELRIFDTAFGRVRVDDYSGLGISNVASIEKQARAFEKFAQLKQEGGDTYSKLLFEELGKQLDRDVPLKEGSWLDQRPRTLKLLSGIVSAMDKVIQFVERVRNFGRGYGFKTVDDIFSDVYSGRIAKRREYDAAIDLFTEDQVERFAMLDVFATDNMFGTDKVSLLPESIGNEVRALDAQIESLKNQAIAGGC